MKKNLVFLWIAVLITFGLHTHAQTYVSPTFGFNSNDYDYVYFGGIVEINDISGKNNYCTGLEIEHFILENFNIAIGGAYNLKKHSYRSLSGGECILFYRTSNFRTWNYYIKSGYNILDWLNLGIGYKKMVFYRYENISDLGHVEKTSDCYNFDNLLLHLNVFYKNFTFSANYSTAIKSSLDNFIFTKFDTFEFKVGYRFLKIFSGGE